MGLLLGIIIFALGILIAVCLHEAGHMLTAKRFGMKVTRYFVGFGPTIWSTRRGETEYGIVSTAFLEHAFRTDSYDLEVTFNADGTWSYVSDTLLTVRGRTEPFLHRDRNTLTKVAEPAPNPSSLAG